MNDIKNVIGILCEHMNQLFDVNLKPEYFRLAKFNKCEQNTVQHFWYLLYKFAEPNNLHIVDSVKLLLHSLNYRSLSFYCLPNDMSYGSRELLLAFGFIISNNEFLCKAIQLKVQNTPFNHNYSILSKSQQNSIDFDQKKFKNDKNKMNAMMWLKGRINSQRKMNIELSDKLKKITTKANNLIKVTNIESLSINEIFALKSTEVSKIFLLQTQIVLKILENHEKWIKKEKVFWEWMNTVTLEQGKYSSKNDYVTLQKFYMVALNNK